MLRYCFALTLLLTAALRSTAAERPPNVIFILTDDQGWADAHFAGHPYVQTPNLDKFASQSTWLRQFYVAATVCSPSRTAFMTSHYPARHFVHGHISGHEMNVARSMPDWLDPQVVTLPGLLKSAGYATAHFGKWHLGSGPTAPPPEAYGIDVSRTTVSNGKPFAEEKDPYFWAKSTGLIVDETIAFIKAHQGQPFYANVWTLLPHATLKPTPEQLAIYSDLKPSAGDPAFGPWMQKYLANAKDLKSQMQVFCASLTDLDTQLGRLFTALEEMKLANDTIIFFSSDNGAEDYRIGNAANGGVGNTGPLRARKRSMYEGGIRTFGLVRWPGHVAAGKRDETSVTGGVDFLPTICKLTSVPLPESLRPDGEDVSDIWLGKPRARKEPLFWEWLFNVQGADYTPPMLTVRAGDWKLFVNHNGTGAQLFNLPQDIGEEHDLAAANPEIVKALTTKALAWAQALPPSKARDDATATGKPQDNGRAPRGAPKPAANATAKPLDRAAIFKKWDQDHNGTLTFDEYKSGLGDKPNPDQRFKTFDTNHDGVLTEEEFVKAGKS